MNITRIEANRGSDESGEELEIVNPSSEGLRRRHRSMLWVALLVTALAVALRVRGDQLVEFRFLQGYPLPETCFSKQWLHVECPGCGLTRSFIYFFQGEWWSSWQLHRIGPLMAVVTLIQIPYRWWGLTHLEESLKWRRAGTAVGWLLTTLLIGNWALRLFGM